MEMGGGKKYGKEKAWWDRRGGGGPVCISLLPAVLGGHREVKTEQGMGIQETSVGSIRHLRRCSRLPSKL